VEDGRLADGEGGIDCFEVGVVVGAGTDAQLGVLDVVGGAGGEGDVGLGGGGVPGGGIDFRGVGFVAGHGAVAREAVEEGVGSGEARGDGLAVVAQKGRRFPPARRCVFR